MPPIRWKLLAVVAIYFMVHNIKYSTCSKLDSLSMVEDGWRPIIGSQQPSYNDEITHYRNPAVKNAETMKAEKPTKATISKSSEAAPAPQTPSPKPTSPVNHITTNLNHGPHHSAKIPPHSKPHLLLPYSGHGPQIPLGPMTHRPMKHGMISKMYPYSMMSGKRHKPIRMQMAAYSTRDEVFAQAPSNNIGTYTFYSPAHNTLKTRINQPHAHIEFTNHYPHQSQDELYQIVRAPVQQYVIPKHPLQNDVHYTFQTQDEFTRNLVPPPYKYVKEKEKPKIKTIELKPETKTDNILVQLPAFNQQHYLQSNPNTIRTTSERAVDVQVTKEKLNVFHNNVPVNYNPRDEYDYHTIKTPYEAKIATYEVTEGKHWQETHPYPFHYSTRAPQIQHRPAPQIQHYQVVHIDEVKPFLPTPLKPESALPTLATESEASTVYNQISQINRQKQEQPTINPSYFSIKEVSTHFPIVGKPDYQPEYPTRFAITEKSHESQDNTEVNEVTTKKYKETYSYESYEEDVPTTRTPTSEYTTRNTQQRKRPNQRRRRPTNRSRITTTEDSAAVTDVYEAQKTDESIEEITERPNRGRRPIRYRTTEAPIEEEKPTPRTRQRRPRPTTEEPTTTEIIPANHKLDDDSSYAKSTIDSSASEDKFKVTTEKEFPASFESHFNVQNNKYSNIENDDDTKSVKVEEYERPSKFYTKPPHREVNQEVDNSSEEMYPEKSMLETTTKEEIIEPSFTSVHTPENEVDYTTKPYFYLTPESVTINEVVELETTTKPTTTSTTTTTTTTPAPSPTKSNRIRGRPMKYDNRDRPRFSVKEYRQRMNAISSTSTTEPSKSHADSMRVRFPNRSRRPITTIGHGDNEEESTEPVRGKFTPKDPRHGSEKNEEFTTEKTIKPVNTRLRPFGRFRSTTEPTSTTQKISIKPNIFSNLRRPTPISLKNRILNKNRISEKTTAKPTEITINEDSLEETNETDMSEIVESTIPYHLDATTEYGSKNTVDLEITKKNDDNTDILKNESFMQSQIVSDLTSSAKNDYNTFKNVSPTSRKVPSYFTISTDDPILPIEAFFPNLKQ